jgi:hypothetical protein
VLTVGLNLTIELKKPVCYTLRKVHIRLPFANNSHLLSFAVHEKEDDAKGRTYDGCDDGKCPVTPSLANIVSKVEVTLS